MRVRRFGTLILVVALALSGCDALAGSPASPSGTGGTPTPTAAGIAYTKAEVEAALLRLDAIELIGFRTYTIPDPSGGLPAKSEDCAVKWKRTNRDLREVSLAHASGTFSQSDTGPFVIHNVTLQPGTGAADAVAAMRASYAGPCKTWVDKPNGWTYTAAENSAKTYGDETYGYQVKAVGNGTSLVIVGALMRKGNLLSLVEYAATPDVNMTKAEAVLAAAGARLPNEGQDSSTAVK